MLRSLGADLQVYKDSYEYHLNTHPNKELTYFTQKQKEIRLIGQLQNDENPKGKFPVYDFAKFK